MPKKGRRWVYDPKPAKLDQTAKTAIRSRVFCEIEKMSRAKGKISRVEVKAGRVYLYELVEQVHPERVTTIPLIDGKYLEFFYARITLYDENGTRCSLDWKRHNEKWMKLDEGTLEECLQMIEQRDEWF